MTGKPSDYGTRVRVQTDFSMPIVVEAGAGTGKTSVLTARILHWLLGPGWEKARETARANDPSAAVPSFHAVAAQAMSRVLALTFTEAAAAEMRARIVEGLRAVEKGETPGASLLVTTDFLDGDRSAYQARAKALMAASHLLTATTIHSFCHGLLRAHPLEAGLHPMPEVDPENEQIEEIARRIVVEKFLPEYSRGSNDSRSKAVMLLAALGIRPAMAIEILTAIGRGAVPPSVLESSGKQSTPLGRAWLEDVLSVAQRLGPMARDSVRFVRKNSTKILKSLALIEGLEETLESNSSLVHKVVQLAELFRDENVSSWCEGKSDNKTGEKILEAYPNFALDLDRLWNLYHGVVQDAIGRVLSPLAELMEQELSSRGILSFDALLRRTARLLGANPHVAKSLRAKLDLMVVDEFQDTDQVQCDIVRRIALEGDEPPNLMLVGDPKQSIYGFRNADLSAYDDFVEQVRSKGGERLVLQANFRSHPAVLQEVEKLVEPLMKEEKGLQPPFERLTAAAEVQVVPGVRRKPVEHWVFPTVRYERKADKQARLEAEAVARDAAALHGLGVPWREMALLLRSTTHLGVFLHALDQHGVPYVTSSSKEYHRREEVTLALSLVKAVLDSEDHVALVGVLRSLLAGLPDAALLQLWSPQYGMGIAARLSDLVSARMELEETLARAESKASGAKGPGQEGVEKGGAGDGQREDAAAEARKRVERAWTELAAGVREVAASVSGLPGMDRIEHWEESLLHFLDALAGLRVSVRRRSTDRFLEELRNFCGIEVLQALAYDGVRRLANLRTLFDELQEALEEGAPDPMAVVRLLRSWTERSERAEPDPPDRVEDALSVLTIHKAKGLGFGHLYVAQLGAERKKNRGGSKEPEFQFLGASEVKRARGGAGAEGDWAFRIGELESERWGEVKAERDAREVREALRLFYVAATRAKSRLVLVGHWYMSGDGLAAGAKGLEDANKQYTSILAARKVSLSGEGKEPVSAAEFLSDHLSEEEDGADRGPQSPVLLDETVEDGQVRYVLFSPAAQTLEQWPPAEEAGAQGGVAGASEGTEAAEGGGREESRIRARDLSRAFEDLAERTKQVWPKRKGAAERMARRWSAAPSHRTKETDWAELFVDELQEEPPELDVPLEVRSEEAVVSAEGRDEVVRHRVAGLLVHRALELWNEKTDDRQAELERVWGLLAGQAELLAGRSGCGPEAEKLARRLLETFASEEGLAKRLAQVGPGILGREVAVLLPASYPIEMAGHPGEDREAGSILSSESDPVSHWAGRVDLLYRDPQTGDIVVADYKTEQVSALAPDEIEAAARVFRPQLQVYAAAVKRALERPVRAEVWFIEASRVVPVPLG